jgi:Ca2+-binding RTX toxin-like protein
VLLGGAGADRLLGDGGRDVASYAEAASGVVADLGTPAANTGEAAGDRYSQVEGLLGSNFADQLRGNGGSNTLDGGAGNDRLAGKLGNDVLTGGAGQDTFLFDTALNGSTNVDRITDFRVVDDTVALENAVFTGLAAGTLQAGAFQTGAAATQADDRVIYDPGTGALLFDADGSGSGAAVRFATLGTGLALTYQDFLVV